MELNKHEEAFQYMKAAIQFCQGNRGTVFFLYKSIKVHKVGNNSREATRSRAQKKQQKEKHPNMNSENVKYKSQF